ncbi:predicted protein, partial [Nematostella vectensis]
NPLTSQMEQISNTSTSLDNTSESGTTDPVGSNHLRTIKLTLYTLIFLVSAAGNTLVCIVILKRKKMKTVTNYFILNLAVADLALTCICIPFDIPVQEMGYIWPYGAVMCKVLYPLQTLTLFASVYTLTAVSLTRYWAIVHPLRKQLSVSKAKTLVIAIWVLSLLPVAPYMNSLSYVPHSKYCEENWDNHNARKGYTASLFAFQYVIPLTIIATAYCSITRELSRRTIESACVRNQQHKETKKVVRMLMIVTLLFAVCVLPNNVMWLWLDFGAADKSFKYFWDVVAFCHVWTFLNSAANPICYTILNENYRKEI